MMSSTWLYALILILLSSVWWWYRELRDFVDGFDWRSGQVTLSRDLLADSPEPTLLITANSRLETPEAVSDQEIIRKYPWTMYTSALPLEKEELELAILVEVAKSSNQSSGDQNLTVNPKFYSDLLRNNQELKVTVLCCWKTGCFQDLRSHDAFLSIQPLSSQAPALEADKRENMLSEGNGAGRLRKNVRANSLKAGGQTINIHGSTINSGGNIQLKLKQIFYSENHEGKIPGWLSSLEYSETHNGLKQKRTPGTGTWFLDSEEFMSWKNSPDRNVLWCPGIPGAGKTIIASHVIDHLRKHTQDTAVLYIYFTYKLHDQQNLNTIVQSLCRQIHEICRTKEISSNFEQLYISHLEHKTRPSTDELLEALRTTLKGFTKAYVVVDALDEYLKQYSDEKIRQLLTTVQSFGNSVKILATSRNIGEMKNLFEELNAIEKEIVADSNDLEAYVNAGIKALDHFSVSTQLTMQVVKKVEEAANGRFLMAELHMNALATQPTLGDLKESLNSLSSEVDRTYQLAMERIDTSSGRYKDLAKETIMWVAYARRPMKVGELQHALATNPGRGNIADFLPSTSTITSACVGLVVIEDGKAAFVHLTTQEFFDEHQARYFPHPHKEIGRICLDYILLPCLPDFASNDLLNFEHAKNFDKNTDYSAQYNVLLDSYPFYDYAALNWGYHFNRHGVDEALTDSILVALKQVDDLLKLVWTRTLREMEIDPFWSNYDVGLDGAGLFLALYHQQRAVFLSLIDKARIPTTKKQRTPFIIAAYLGLPDFIELMVQTWGADDSHPKQIPDDSQLPQTEETDDIQVHVASPDDAGHTPLWYAVSKGHTAVVRLLLQYPATQVNATSNKYWGWTPLLLAASKGFDEAAELLLKCPMLDINLPDTDGETALRSAAGRGFHTFVKLLLEHPAIDVNLADHNGVSPVLAASKRGDTSTLKLLLEFPMLEINSQDTDGETALQIAVGGGFHTFVKLLLEHPAIDVNLADHNGVSPVLAASRRGDTSTLKLLLEFPMLDINSQDTDGETALRIAVGRGFHTFVKLLLEHPAIDVNLADHAGVSPFLAALGRQDVSILGLLLDRRKPSQPVDPLQDTVGPLTVDINVRNIYGKSVLAIAARDGFVQAVDWLLNYTGIDPDLRSSHGCSPLALASECGHADVVQLLLNRAPVNINNIDNDGATPLICAAYNGHASVAKVLLDQPRIQVNVQDGRGQTALSRACDVLKTPFVGGEKTEAEAYPFVALLLEHKDINVNLADKEGKTPLDYASRSGFQKVVELIQRGGTVMSSEAESTSTNDLS